MSLTPAQMRTRLRKAIDAALVELDEAEDMASRLAAAAPTSREAEERRAALARARDLVFIVEDCSA